MTKRNVERSGVRRSRRRGGALVAVAIAVALVASGCSSNAGGGQSSPGGDQGSTIMIGLPHPLTGVWADASTEAIWGAQLAIEDINNAGGIKALGGANLQGIEADTTSTDPGQAATVTRRLIESDKVNALIGSNVSSFTLTGSTEAEKAEIPMLTQSYSDELTKRGYKYLFQFPPTASKIGESLNPYVTEAFAKAGIDIKKVAVMVSNDASNRAGGEAAIAQAKEAGLDVVSEAFFQPDLTDATIMAQDVVRKDPDIVFLGGPTAAVVTTVTTLRDLGYDGPIAGIGGGGMLTPQFGELLGDNINGVLSMSAWNWDLGYEDMTDVEERYTKQYDQPFMGPLAGETYAGVWMLKEAMEQAKSSEPAKIAAALRDLEFNSGPASWMPGGKIKFDASGRNTYALPILIQWQDGVTKTIWPLNVQKAEPQG